MPRQIISREIWERFQFIDFSILWQPKSNYLKCANRPTFYTPDCSRSHKGLAPCQIISQEIWERFQFIDISTLWQPKSNYLKCAKSGQKRVVKEMITGSLPSFFLFFPAPPTFRMPFTLGSSPLSGTLEQARSDAKSHHCIISDGLAWFCWSYCAYYNSGLDFLGGIPLKFEY